MGHLMKWLSPKFARFILLATIPASIGWSTLTPVHAQAASPDVYLCDQKGIAAMEYSKDTKQWAATTYGLPTNSELKFVFRRAKPGEKFKWGYFVHLSKYPLIECQNDFSEDGTISCQQYEDRTFLFNRNNLRYQKTTQDGYVNPDEPEDEGIGPHIEFGKCHPL
jgi:hypothetical protein